MKELASNGNVSTSLSTTLPNDQNLQDRLLHNLLKVQYPIAQEDPPMTSDEPGVQSESSKDYHARMRELMEEHQNEW